MSTIVCENAGSLENAAMIAVFRKNGCREFARMCEWDLLLEVDDD